MAMKSGEVTQHRPSYKVEPTSKDQTVGFHIGKIQSNIGNTKPEKQNKKFD